MDTLKLIHPPSLKLRFQIRVIINEHEPQYILKVAISKLEFSKEIYPTREETILTPFNLKKIYTDLWLIFGCQ